MIINTKLEKIFSKMLNKYVLKKDIEGTILFDNNEGQIGDVLLKENPLNYKRLEIEYVDSGNDNTSSKMINISNLKRESARFWLDFFLFDSTGNVYFYATSFSLKEEGLILDRAGTYIISIASEVHINQTNTIKITKVVGYHY